MNISKFGTTDSQVTSSPIKIIGIDNKVSKSGDTMFGDLNLNNHKIINLPTPVSNSEAVTKLFLENRISNFLQFQETPEFGSKLAITGIDNDSNHVVSFSPIQVRGHDLYGLENIFIFSETRFRIEKLNNPNVFIEMNGSLTLKGLANPTEPKDAVTKEFVENLVRSNNVESDIDLRNTHTIVNLRDPIEPKDAATKEFVENLVTSNNFVNDIDLGNTHTIINLRDPLSSNEATNKNYVDEKTQTLDYIDTEEENIATVC